MKSLLPYLIIAAVVLAWTLRGEPLSLEEAALAVPVNYALLILPQVCWFGIARFLDAPPAVKHAGLVGATAPLIGLAIVFECCVDNSNGLGWAYYWPAAILGIIAFVWLARRTIESYGKNA
jgi:hypothetical protein